MTMPMSAAAATSMTPVGQTGSVAYVLFISAIAAIGGFLFGFDSGVINGTVTALGKAFQSTAVATGFNVASVLLGCAIGARIVQVHHGGGGPCHVGVTVQAFWV